MGEPMQKGPINYWIAVRGVDFRTAVREVSEWLGHPITIEDYGLAHDPAQSERTAQTVSFPPGLCAPTEDDLQLLARSRTICIEALRIATQRGFIFCFNHPRNGRCWLYTDGRRRCGLRRRLNNRSFVLKDGQAIKCAACRGSSMRDPIGYQEAAIYPCIGIAEGGPNALAILAHAWASGAEDRVAPICMPSANSNFTQSSLAWVQNKRARIFMDDDDAGQKAADRWATQLKSVGVTVDGFSFGGLITTAGRSVKDLNDLLQIDFDCWEEHHDQVENIMAFAL